RRRSTFPRFDWRRSIDNSEPLKGQLWSRSEKALQEPDVHWLRRAAAGAVAVFEAAVLLWLLLGPATAIRNVEVHGANHMTAALERPETDRSTRSCSSPSSTSSAGCRASSASRCRCSSSTHAAP